MSGTRKSTVSRSALDDVSSGSDSDTGHTDCKAGSDGFAVKRPRLTSTSASASSKPIVPPARAGSGSIMSYFSHTASAARKPASPKLSSVANNDIICRTTTAAAASAASTSSASPPRRASPRRVGVTDTSPAVSGFSPALPVPVFDRPNAATSSSSSSIFARRGDDDGDLFDRLVNANVANSTASSKLLTRPVATPAAPNRVATPAAPNRTPVPARASPGAVVRSGRSARSPGSNPATISGTISGSSPGSNPNSNTGTSAGTSAGSSSGGGGGGGGGNQDVEEEDSLSLNTPLASRLRAMSARLSLGVDLAVIDAFTPSDKVNNNIGHGSASRGVFTGAGSGSGSGASAGSGRKGARGPEAGIGLAAFISSSATRTNALNAGKGKSPVRAVNANDDVNDYDDDDGYDSLSPSSRGGRNSTLSPRSSGNGSSVSISSSVDSAAAAAMAAFDAQCRRLLGPKARQLRFGSATAGAAAPMTTAIIALPGPCSYNNTAITAGAGHGESALDCDVRGCSGAVGRLEACTSEGVQRLWLRGVAVSTRQMAAPSLFVALVPPDDAATAASGTGEKADPPVVVVEAVESALWVGTRVGTVACPPTAASLSLAAKHSSENSSNSSSSGGKNSDVSTAQKQQQKQQQKHHLDATVSASASGCGWSNPTGGAEAGWGSGIDLFMTAPALTTVTNNSTSSNRRGR